MVDVCAALDAYGSGFELADFDHQPIYCKFAVAAGTLEKSCAEKMHN
jgi:hypothetical protein